MKPAVTSDSAASGERFMLLGMQTASILHELNNKLTSMVCGMELFVREDLDPRCRARCEKIVAAHKGLVELLREANSLVSGHDNEFLVTETVQLADLMGRVEKDVAFEISGSVDGFDVRCDARKARRAIGDIVRNAWQAGASNVRLAAFQFDEFVVVRIVDDGPGIVDEMVGRLFSPGATHGKQDGHGIGLFSAKWILEAMGGSLRLERTDAAGTSFVVTLPRVDPDDPSWAASMSGGNPRRADLRN